MCVDLRIHYYGMEPEYVPSEFPDPWRPGAVYCEASMRSSCRRLADATHGISPDEEKLNAIQEFPAPTDIPAGRSLLGLLSQLGIFIPDAAHIAANGQALLKKDGTFTWAEAQEFNQINLAHISIQHFDPNCQTHLTGASCLKGIGYAFIQCDSNNKATLIHCGSCSLKAAEQHYATVELECLTIIWPIISASITF